MFPWLKLLHVVGVVLFLGNVVTGLFWHAHAARTRDPRLLAHAVDGLIRGDRLFTVPGVVLIVASGVTAAVAGGYPLLHTGWIAWSILLFTASGVVFVARVAPLQRRLLALASVGPGSFDWEGYRRAARAWELWGAVATATPAAAMILMVVKPG
jgi:uncharacterized membrane protein